MPKDIGMTYQALAPAAPASANMTPWALRAWPPLLWQVRSGTPMRLFHLDTRVIFAGGDLEPPSGQTVWASQCDDGEVGMAWDWVQVTRGVVAMADPMSVVTNLRLVGAEGEVLTASEAALFLNQYVRSLPWQSEVRRALSALPH
jgi:hypothetical protein